MKQAGKLRGLRVRTGSAQVSMNKASRFISHLCTY